MRPYWSVLVENPSKAGHKTGLVGNNFFYIMETEIRNKVISDKKDVNLIKERFNIKNILEIYCLKKLSKKV